MLSRTGRIHDPWRAGPLLIILVFTFALLSGAAGCSCDGGGGESDAGQDELLDPGEDAAGEENDIPADHAEAMDEGPVDRPSDEAADHGGDEAGDPGIGEMAVPDVDEAESPDSAPEPSCGDGICLDTETAAGCPADCPPCGPLSPEGCCDGDVLHRCLDGTMREETCGDPGCGWSAADAGYACGFTGEDPGGDFIRSCGCELPRSLTYPRVFHGTAAPEAVCLSPGQILAVGALVTLEPYGYYEFCTATLTAPTIVLSAAHCVFDHGTHLVDPSTIFFAVGDDIASPVRVFAVASVAPNPLYDRRTEYDMSVVVLAESAVDALPSIKPIPINRSALDASFVGQTVQNVGYGQTHDDPYNTRRWWTAEPVVDLLPGYFTVFGNYWSSVCFGDSGGPSLYAFDSQAVRIAGTVSGGDASCMEHDYFPRADDNTDFLDPYLSGLDPCLGLDGVGACEGTVAFWCEGGDLRQECCPEACGRSDAGLMRCITHEEACGGVTELGECRGDELVWCSPGGLQRRLCNVCGGAACGWVDDTTGYDCIGP